MASGGEAAFDSSGQLLIESRCCLWAHEEWMDEGESERAGDAWDEKA